MLVRFRDGEILAWEPPYVPLRLAAVKRVLVREVLTPKEWQRRKR